MIPFDFDARDVQEVYLNDAVAVAVLLLPVALLSPQDFWSSLPQFQLYVVCSSLSYVIQIFTPFYQDKT